MMVRNQPSQEEVVALMKQQNIGKYRIFKAEPTVLKAFANSGIELIVGVANENLASIASNPDEATKWVNDNIVAYPATIIKYIAVGNEVLGKLDNMGQILVGAMNNVQTALQKFNLENKIYVSTTHALTSVIDELAPKVPSKGTFTENKNVANDMRSVLDFLVSHGSPFMANVYPYFTYDANRNDFNVDYALFKSTATPITDGGRIYRNLFDDSAMEAMGHPTDNLHIVVTESGWPSNGTELKADIATMDNARTYNNNLIKHVLSNAGTPKWPGRSIETYIFALFNEDQKRANWNDYDTEKHYGLFYANKKPVCAVNFSPYS